MSYPAIFLSEPSFGPGFRLKNAKHLGSFVAPTKHHPFNEDRLVLCFCYEKDHRKRSPREIFSIQKSDDGSPSEAWLGPSGSIDTLLLDDYFFEPGEREIPFSVGEIILRFDGTMIDVFLRKT